MTLKTDGDEEEFLFLWSCTDVIVVKFVSNVRVAYSISMGKYYNHALPENMCI